MSAHLGPLVSALVDDQLEPALREKALAHLVCCPRCAQEVQDTRAARALLNKAHEMPALRDDFMSGLLSLAQDCDPPRTVPVSHDNPFITREPIPGGAYCGKLSGKQSLRKWATYGSVFALGGACAAAFILGARPLIAPQSDYETLVERLDVLRGSSAFSPLYDVARTQPHRNPQGVDHGNFNTLLYQHGLAPPKEKPEGVTIKEVGFLATRPTELEIVIATPIGEVLVVEHKGVLDGSTVDSASVIDHELGPIYVLGDAPTHLVWQSEEAVIELITDIESEDLMQFAHTFAAEQHDEGLTARFARGFSVLAGVVSE
jgi:hypothetical protein